MAEEDDKHKNNANESLSARSMQMRLLSTRTMPNEFAKHTNNANEAAKEENDGK